MIEFANWIVIYLFFGWVFLILVSAAIEFLLGEPPDLEGAVKLLPIWPVFWCAAVYSLAKLFYSRWKDSKK